MSGEEKRTAKGTRLIKLIEKYGGKIKQRPRVARCPYCGAGLTIPLQRHLNLESDCQRQDYLSAIERAQ